VCGACDIFCIGSPSFHADAYAHKQVVHRCPFQGFLGLRNLTSASKTQMPNLLSRSRSSPELRFLRLEITCLVSMNSCKGVAGCGEFENVSDQIFFYLLLFLNPPNTTHPPSTSFFSRPYFSLLPAPRIPPPTTSPLPTRPPSTQPSLPLPHTPPMASHAHETYVPPSSTRPLHRQTAHSALPLRRMRSTDPLEEGGSDPMPRLWFRILMKERGKR